MVIKLPAGYPMNCEPTRYLSIEEIVELLREQGFEVEVEDE